MSPTGVTSSIEPSGPYQVNVISQPASSSRAVRLRTRSAYSHFAMRSLCGHAACRATSPNARLPVRLAPAEYGPDL